MTLEKVKLTEQEKIIRIWRKYEGAPYQYQCQYVIKATLKAQGREDLIPKDGVK